MHALKFYLPIIVKDSWEKFELGVGLFTIQGYEHKNKESKNTLQKFTNQKGNLVKQSSKRLCGIYYFNITAV